MTKESQRWLVSRIRGSRAEEIAVVSAEDALSAILVVVKERCITDSEYIERLVARPAGIPKTHLSFCRPAFLSEEGRVFSEPDKALTWALSIL
jgi:hypothetical protein